MREWRIRCMTQMTKQVFKLFRLPSAFGHRYRAEDGGTRCRREKRDRFGRSASSVTYA